MGFSRQVRRFVGVAATLTLGFVLLAASARPASQKKSPSVVNRTASRAVPEARIPFRSGEALDYRVLWSQWLVNAATVRLAVREQRLFHGRQAWHLQAQAHTVDLMRLLYPLDDQFDSYSEPPVLASLQYEMYIREQGKRETVISRMSSGADPPPGSGPTVRVLPGTRDPLGFLYYLRALDWQRTREIRSHVYDGRKLYEVKARLVQERGEISVPAGQFVASRIEVRAYERGREVAQTGFWVWLAHDELRTPVLIEAEVPLGTARVELTRAQ